MADSIIRLKVESQEYDAKLKRASEGLTRYADECRKVGGTLEVVEKDTLDYVRSLGRMDTASRTATGKLAEMKKAFVELSAQYKQMTDAEKASPFGKALAQSLSQLKTRIGESRSQLEGIKQEMSGGLSGALDAVAGKFGLNVGQLTKFGGALAAASTAAKVAKDAFFNNEEQLDEWGRVVQSSQSLYEGFLNALNTGDIGGYLSNISNIVQAARDAYDALDALGTYNAFNQINVERTHTQMTQAIADFRSGEGTREQAKAAGEAYKNELRERQKMERDAYLAAVKDLAAKRGVNAGDLQKALSGSYGNYQQLKNTPLTGTAERYSPGIMPGQAGTYTQYKVAANERERLGEALRHINDTELRSLQALGAQAQRTGNEIAQVDRTMSRFLTNGRSSSSGGRTSSSGFKAESISSKYQQGMGINQTESMASLRQQLSAAQQGYAGATNMIDAGAYQQQIKQLQEQIKAQPLALSMGISTDAAATLMDQINTLTDEMEINPIEITVTAKGVKGLDKDIDVLQKTTKNAGSAMSQLGSALQGLEDPSAKVAGIIMEAIGNVALAFSQAMLKPKDPWSWIAFAVAGTATMISTIAAIHSATGYAEGGMIPGNSYSGDNQLARVNAGEIILNRAQQSNVAAALENPAQAAPANRPSFVRGQDIYLGLNNYLRASGRGQLITSRQ
jgi:hypothetical protein